jgi:hypothetical protein
MPARTLYRISSKENGGHFGTLWVRVSYTPAGQGQRPREALFDIARVWPAEWLRGRLGHMANVTVLSVEADGMPEPPLPERPRGWLIESLFKCVGSEKRCHLSEVEWPMPEPSWREFTSPGGGEGRLLGPVTALDQGQRT